MIGQSQLLGELPVDRQLFEPLVADDPRVAILAHKMAKLASYMLALGPTHAAVS